MIQEVLAGNLEKFQQNFRKNSGNFQQKKIRKVSGKIQNRGIRGKFRVY